MSGGKTAGKMKSKTEKQIDFAKVGAKIDNKAPRFDPENYLKSRKMLADSVRLKAIDEDNLELVQRLNVVHRLGGKVDCYNTIPAWRLYKSRLTDVESKNVAMENNKIMREIISTKSTYPTAELLRDWKRIEENIEHTAKFPLIWKNPSGLKEESNSSRTRCFFDVEIAESKYNLGRIVFELYDDFVPDTCANFTSFCRGTEQGFSYKGTPFHWILPEYWCQGGDVTKFNGTGGTSIYGDKFKDENFTLRHLGPGFISMWSNGPDTNNSKFNITFKSLGTMDGRRVVFGKVLRGLTNLYKIEELGSRAGKPFKRVIVSNCGVYQNNSQR